MLCVEEQELKREDVENRRFTLSPSSMDGKSFTSGNDLPSIMSPIGSLKEQTPDFAFLAIRPSGRVYFGNILRK